MALQPQDFWPDGQSANLDALAFSLNGVSLPEATVSELLLEGEDVAVFLLDAQFRFLWVYHPFAGIYEPGQMLGKTDRELGLPADLADQVEAIVAQVLHTGEPRTFEFWAHTPGGEHRFFQILYKPCEYKPGQMGVLARSRDLTTKRQSEQELNQAYELLERSHQDLKQAAALFDQAFADEAFTIALQGPDLRYKWIFNPLAPHKAEDLLGRNDLEIAASEANQQVTAIKTQVLQSGHPVRLARWVDVPGQGQRYFVSQYHRMQLADGTLGLLTKMRDETEGHVVQARLRKLNNDLTDKVKALAESEDRLRLVIEAAQINIGFMDPDLRYSHVYNPISPYTEADLLGKTNLEIENSTQEARQYTYDIVKNVLETGRTHTEMWHFPTQEGAKRHIRVTTQRHTLPDGRFGVFNHFIDQTDVFSQQEELRSLNADLVNSLEALRLSEDRLQLAIQDTPITAILIFDDALRCIWAYTTLPGVQAADFVGKTDYDFSIIFSAEQAAYYQDLKRKVLATGKGLSIEEEFPTGDGGKRWFKTRYAPLSLGEQKPGVIVRVVDITEERTRTEHVQILNRQLTDSLAALKVSEDRLKAAIADTPVSTLLLYDADLVVVWEHQTFPGAEPGAMVGKHILDLPVGAFMDLAPYQAMAQQVLATGQANGKEEWATFGDNRFCISTSYTRIELGNGQSGLICRVLDITAERMRQEELHSLNQQLKDSLAAQRLSEDQLRLALANTPISMAMYDQEARAVWGYNIVSPWTFEQIKGRTDFEIEGLPRAEAEYYYTRKKQVVETGKPIEEILWFDVPGSLRRCFKCNYDPIALPDGSPGVLMRVLDVTDERQRAEALEHVNLELQTAIQDLRTSEERLRIALTGEPYSLYLQDENAVFIWAYNPSPPWRVEDLLGKGQYEIGLTTADADQISAYTTEARQTGEPVRREMWVGLPGVEGSHCFQLTYAPFPLGEGRVGVMTKALDVTAERQTQQELAKLAENLRLENARANQLLQEVQRESSLRLQQLQEAREMQLAMLPCIEAVAPPYKLAASMITCLDVGGDYYDFVTLTGGGLAMAFGDATGHGVRAGMMVASVKSMFMRLATRYAPAALLDEISLGLEAMHLRQLFMALSALQLEPDGRCLYATAGMPPIFIYRAANGQVEKVGHQKVFLGTGLGITYSQDELCLAEGDMLLLASDGLTEARNPQGAFLPQSMIEEALAIAAPMGPQAVLDAINALLRSWMQSDVFFDDVTLVALAYGGKR